MKFGGREINCGYARDITERKRAEEALTLFRTLVDRTNDAIEVLDVETGRFLDMNERACLDLGYSREELLSLTVFDIDPTADQTSFKSAVEKMRKTGVVKLEGIHRRKDGSTFPVEVHVKYVQLDRDYIVTVARDITERKRAEEALRRSEEQWRSLVSSSPDYIALHDREGRYLFLNHYAEGYSEKDILGKMAFDLVSPETRERYRSTFESCIRTGIKQACEYVAPGDLGEPRTYESTFVPIVGREDENSVLVVARDISERKQAETNLKRLLEWQEAIFEGSHDAVFISDGDSRFVAVNKAASDLTGYSREQLLKMRIPDLHDHPDLHAYERFHQAILDGENILSEAKVLRSDGAKVDTEFNNKRISVAGSLYIHTTARDITERKRAEDALRQSEEKFRNLFNNAEVGMFITRLDGSEVVEFNQKYLNILGYTSEEVRSKSSKSVWADRSERDRMVELLKARGQVTDFECGILNKQGEVRRCITSLRLNRDTGILEGSIQDITERKRAEEALRVSEEHFSKLFQSSPDSILLTELKSGNVMQVNKSFEKYSGYSRDEVLGRSVLELNMYGPTDRQRFLSMLQGQGRVRDIEFHLRNKEGQELLMSASAELIDIAREPCAITILHDITERKRAEERLLASQEQLHLLARHLQSVREEERKHLSQEFHDQLGQLLTALKMDLSMLHRSIADPGKELSRTVIAIGIETMQAMIDRAIGIIREIMSELRPEMLDQLGIIPTLEWEAERFRRHSGLSCTFNSEVQEMVLDPKQSIALYRIFQEALTNVARHAKATSVDVALRKESNGCALEIKDNGIGMAADAEEKAYSFGVIGMRERALMFGGSLEIRGIEGKGTTVLVRIPDEQALADRGGAI